MIRTSSVTIFSVILYASGVLWLCSPAAADKSTSQQVQEILGGGTSGELRERTVDRLVELGEPCVALLCDRIKKGVPRPNELEALVRLGTQLAQETVLQCLQQQLDGDELEFSTSIPLIRALARLQVQASEPVLLEIVTAASEIADPKSEKLAIALDAAAALMSVGCVNARTIAEDFAISVMEDVSMGVEDLARDSLLIVLTQLNTPEALQKLTVAIKTEGFISADVFRSLPKKSDCRELVEALYERVRDPGLEWTFTPAADFAALEALSEMDLTDDVVPPCFWQEYWENRKNSMVRDAPWQPVPERVREDMLTDRMREFIRRRNLKL